MGSLKGYPSEPARYRSPTPVEEGFWDIGDLEEKVNRPTQWGSVATRTFKAYSVSHDKLPAGCYSVTRDNNDGQPVFMGKYIKNDKIIRFREGITNKILKEIEEFWDREQIFLDNGFLHRRGFLLYGPQGTGKSSVVWQVAQNVIRRGGIVFVCDNPRFFADGLKVFRQVEPNRPLVCVFEDIDAIIKRYEESEILSLLDGDSQIDHVVNIATTNYPEVLDKRIVNRPRRFDRIYKIVAPEDAVRIAFLKEKLPSSQDKRLWIRMTKGLSFAALAECLISVICLGNDLIETVKILRDIESKTPRSSDFGNGIGFSSGDDDDVPAKG